MLAFLVSCVLGWRTTTCQLSGFYCNVCVCVPAHMLVLESAIVRPKRGNGCDTRCEQQPQEAVDLHWSTFNPQVGRFMWESPQITGPTVVQTTSSRALIVMTPTARLQLTETATYWMYAHVEGTA